MLGFTREQLLSLRCSDIHPNDIDELKTLTRSVLEKGGGLSDEFHCRTKEGSFIPVEISAASIIMKGRACIMAVVRDITERKKSEESSRLAGIVFRSAAEAIMITDADEKIISINPAFIEITGFSEEEIVGQTPRMFHSGRHDRAFYQELWNILIATGQWKGEIWDKKKDGTIYPKWLSIIAVRNKTGEIGQYISLFSDITERKEMEQQIFQNQKLENIGQLAGGVAHEFNNLMTPIIGYVDIVLEQTSHQPEIQESLLMIKKAGRRASALTKELLSFSKKTRSTSRRKPSSLLQKR